MPGAALTSITHSTSGGCRVGIDIVRIADVLESVQRFGDRYLTRIFTQQELSCCADDADVAAASLAARLAAKEATIKVLRPTGAQPDWRAMEVVRQPSGACDLALHGTAARMAAADGLGPLAVSLTHEHGFAAAVVFAIAPGDQPLVMPAVGSVAAGDPGAEAPTEFDLGALIAKRGAEQICSEKGRQHGRFRFDGHTQF